MKLRWLAAVGILSAACCAMVMSQAAGQERFDLKVRNYFFAGFAGDAESLQKAMSMCEEALASDPKNAQALVWHGSGMYFQAGQAFQKGDQEKGMSLYQRGIQEMDQAVAIAPDTIGVRIPRGAVLLTGSRFMSPEMAKPLIEKGVSDFEKAYEIQSPALDQLGRHPKGELLLGLADGYGRLGNEEKAREFYTLILKEMPGTAYSKKADNWMDTKTSQTACLGCHTGK
jgi:tetratricopeptide (TPR) repeat protein